MEKAYQYRIYPNKKQKELIAKNFGCDGLHLYCKSDLIDFYKKLGFKKIGNYQGRIEMIRSF